MKDEKEEMLLRFLKELDKHVFITSVNSITTQEEHLDPMIEDYEGTILISGEWDREDLKNILASLSK